MNGTASVNYKERDATEAPTQCHPAALVVVELPHRPLINAHEDLSAQKHRNNVSVNRSVP